MTFLRLPAGHFLLLLHCTAGVAWLLGDCLLVEVAAVWGGENLARPLVAQPLGGKARYWGCSLMIMRVLVQSLKTQKQ